MDVNHTAAMQAIVLDARAECAAITTEVCGPRRSPGDPCRTPSWRDIRRKYLKLKCLQRLACVPKQPKLFLLHMFVESRVEHCWVRGQQSILSLCPGVATQQTIS